MYLIYKANHKKASHKSRGFKISNKAYQGLWRYYIMPPIKFHGVICLTIVEDKLVISAFDK